MDDALAKVHRLAARDLAAKVANYVPAERHGGVLITIHRLSQGGADRVTMLIANGLAAAGIPTTILVLRSGGEAEPMLLSLLDARVAIVFAGPPIGSRHLELVRGYRRLRREIAYRQPRTVLASSSNMGLVTGLVKRSSGPNRLAFVMKLTNPVVRPRDDNRLKRLYRRTLYGMVFGGFDRVLILTDKEREWVSRIYPRYSERFETVSNPYVTSAMLARGAMTDGKRGRRILTAARMMPQKRLERLISAVALIADQSVTLTILGDGPGRQALESHIAGLGLRSRVQLVGFVEDVVPWLCKADVFALSSDYEGLPAVVLEALACNVPVVTTDCFAGARDLLGGLGCCAVVARDDVEGLARALEASLAGRVPPDLGLTAKPYGIDEAVAAHVCVLSRASVRARG